MNKKQRIIKDLYDAGKILQVNNDIDNKLYLKGIEMLKDIEDEDDEKE